MAETGPGQQAARPRRIARTLAIVLGALLLLLLGVYVALRQAYPPARLAGLLSEQVGSLTGRSLRIEGGLSMRLLPSIAIEAGDVVLANPEWASMPDMLRARRVAFVVSLRELLTGRVHVESIELQGADLWLESDARGRVNWRFEARPETGIGTAATATSAAAAGSALRFYFDGIEASDIRVTFSDQRRLSTYVFGIESLALEAASGGSRLDAELAYGAGHWRVTGRTGAIAELFHGGADWPLDLKSTSEGASIAAHGSLGTGARAGSFEADASARFDSATALEAFGMPASSWPLPIEVSATLKRSRESLEARSLRLSLRGQLITGHGLLQTGASGHRLDAELSAAAIDLEPLLRPAAATGSGAAAAPRATAGTLVPKRRLFGDSPLPNFHLPAFPTALALKVERLSAPGLPDISALDVQLVSDPLRIVAQPLRFGIAGGEVSGRLDILMRPDVAPHTDLQLDASNLSAEILGAAMNEGRRLFAGGRVRAALKLSMTGRTPRSMAASSSGDLLLVARDVGLADRGARTDRDIVARLIDTVIPGSSAGETLMVQCAVARLPLRQGVAAIDRGIALETRQIAVAASGELNFARQTVDLSFRPRVKRGLDVNPASLVEMAVLRGPMESPQISLSARGVARQAANVGVAAATGGASLLLPVLRPEAGDASACQRAEHPPAAAAVPPAKGRR